MKTTFVMVLIVCAIGLVVSRSVAEDEFNQLNIDDVEPDIGEKHLMAKRFSLQIVLFYISIRGLKIIIISFNFI